jgi:hypothetical protein
MTWRQKVVKKFMGRDLICRYGPLEKMNGAVEAANKNVKKII